MKKLIALISVVPLLLFSLCAFSMSDDGAFSLDGGQSYMLPFEGKAVIHTVEAAPFRMKETTSKYTPMPIEQNLSFLGGGDTGFSNPQTPLMNTAMLTFGYRDDAALHLPDH